MSNAFDRPDHFLFNDVTDDAGKIHVKRARPMKLNHHYELAVTNCNVDLSTLLNIYENELDFLVDGVHRFLPPCLVRTVFDLLSNMNIMLRETDWNVELREGWNIGVLRGKAGKNITIPQRVASSLGILDKRNQLSSFFLQVNSSGYTFEMTPLPSSSTENTHVLIKCEDGNEIVQLPAPRQRIIWQQISPNSFACFHIDTDLARSEFVGRELTETVAIVPFDPYSDQDAVVYIPPKLDWRRVAKTDFKECFIRFATSSGRPLIGVKAQVHVSIRRKHIG